MNLKYFLSTSVGKLFPDLKWSLQDFLTFGRFLQGRVVLSYTYHYTPAFTNKHFVTFGSENLHNVALIQGMWPLK